MSERRNAAVFSIAPHRPFADTLVQGVLGQFGSDNHSLAGGLVIVPNNRARSALIEAFVRLSANGLLLPRIVAIGDPELNERIGGALDPMDGALIPPAIDPAEREFVLAQMLVDQGFVENGAPAMAIKLAADLARVIDQLNIYDKSSRDFKKIDAPEVSEHWDRAFKALIAILAHWPAYCSKRGMIDLSDRRNRLLKSLSERWRSAPPKGFVIAAGISMTAPVVAALLRSIADMPNGQVVLAGLDLDMSDAAWDALVDRHALETHPQYHLRLLLDRMDVSRALVAPWPSAKGSKDAENRAAAVSHAMAPAAFTAEWAKLPDEHRRLSGVSALVLPTAADEAQVIALALRQAIETPEKRAALITPDRNLANRVSTLLKRWDILADDSAGQALSSIPTGTFLLALVDGAAAQFDPASLLAILKHPLTFSGERRLKWLDGVRAIDLVLRGPRPKPGLSGITAMIESKGDDIAKEFWQAESAPLCSFEAEAVSSLTGHITNLVMIANALSGDMIWTGPEGRQAAELLAQLQDYASSYSGVVTAQEFATILRFQMDRVSVRAPEGGHPRIAIWGLLEAKLQSVDTVVLGGLNESVWPQAFKPDPWLAPAIRRALGLPGADYRVGVAAHDLVSAMGASTILLTRAERDEAGVTSPSRFWLRLNTLAKGFKEPTTPYDAIARALDDAEGSRAKRPSFAPPIEERPRRISVTEVETLRADPYAFYAKKMLGLRMLDSPGEEPDAAWRGTFLHQILAQWGEGGFLPDALLPLLRNGFANSALHPVVQSLWLPRFEEAAQRFVAFVEQDRADGREPAQPEVDGSIIVDGVRLHGRADRLDRLQDGGVAIVDYKTGTPPAKKKTDAGYTLQLGLLGKIADQGGFEGFDGNASVFEYWSQARKSPDPYGYVQTGLGKEAADPETFADYAFGFFRIVLDDYLLGDAPFTAKLRPEYAYAEYDHLMRFEEWQGRDGGA